MATSSVQGDLLRTLRALSDDELLAQLKSVLACERASLASVVAYVAELSTRDLWLRAGYGSLFVFCRDALALSDGDAYHRIEVARAARRFPVVLDLLAEGAVNVTTVRLLAPYLTPQNHREVLDTARGKRKVEVEEIMVRLAPRPEAPSFVRRLPARVPEASSSPYPPTTPPSPDPPAPQAGPTWAASQAPGHALVPLAPALYRLQVTIDGALLEKLRLAKDMLRHVIPSGTDAAILERALTTLLAELARQKFAAADHPRPASAATPGSRHIPAEVKRTVWLRDLGRCAYLAPGDRRCEERGFVEFHHVKPYAAGGEATVANIQLRCRRHNQYEARLFFGSREETREDDVRTQRARPSTS